MSYPQATCPKCGKTGNKGSIGTHMRYCGRDYEPVFWGRVHKTDGCWLWKGALQRDGYAHFTYRQKTISSHRYAYELIVGPVPDGLDLLHSCDVRHCVNPAHLRPGTHQENMTEAMAKLRHVHGARSKHAKLTEANVREIRKLYRGVGRGHRSNVRELAAKYGVNAGTIANVALRHTWRYVK